MEGTGTVHLLRLIHVVAGVFWAGAAIFIAFFLLPSVRAVGPAAGPIMEQLGKVRRLPLYMMGATVLTILSGFSLYWRDSAGFTGPWMGSGSGFVFGFGGIVATVAAGVGMALTSPAARRMGELAAGMRAGGGPPSPATLAEMQTLQAKVSRSSLIGAILLLVATAAMAVARYVP